MYMYFSMFKSSIALLVTGIIITILYCYGFWSSGRFHAKKKDSLSLYSSILATFIAIIPGLVLCILAVSNLEFTNKWTIATKWQNVVFRLWNSPFIGIYSWIDEVAKKTHSLSILKNWYIITTLLLPISNILGFITGILEKENRIKLPEITFLKPPKQPRSKNQPNKTGKTY